MKEKIDRILEDIYALEPALRERDAEVRVMVSELLKARPAVVLDPAFVAGLRARILEGAAPKVAVPTPYRHDILWWALRIAPIGALAAITLALIGSPENPQIPMSPETTPRSFNAAEPTAGPVRSVAPAAGDAMMMKTVSPDMGMGGGVSAESSASDAATMMDYGSADTDEAVASDSIFVAEQGPGKRVVIENLTLSVAAHVRIFAYQDGAPRAVLGTSGVLQAGGHARVSVALSRTTSAGETLYAQVFASDGDDIFTPYEDVPQRDSAGNLIYAIFMISDM